MRWETSRGVSLYFFDGMNRPRTSPKPFRVLCDMVTDGGGWTIIQRRGDFNRQSDFFVGWSSYKRGFGDLNRDFWLGNEKIFALTNQDEYRLHIDLMAFSNETRFADYEWFFVTSEQTKYTLNLGRFMSSSTAGDSLYYNRGMRFTTRDQDNDQSMSSQCAENYKSGWWHAGCTLANLNGLYSRGNDSTATGVFWNNWLGAKYSLKGCEMKVRPTGFNTEMLS
jgi:ficolin